MASSIPDCTKNKTMSLKNEERVWIMIEEMTQVVQAGWLKQVREGKGKEQFTHWEFSCLELRVN